MKESEGIGKQLIVMTEVGGKIALYNFMADRLCVVGALCLG
jgi:hypothetical protein